MASTNITIPTSTVQRMMHHFLDSAAQHHAICQAILRKAGLARLAMLDGEVHHGSVYSMNGVILRAWIVDDVMLISRGSDRFVFELCNPGVIELIHSTIDDFTKEVMANLKG